MGTETRGSILSPSTANGVVGLRPTYGRVSRHGAMALSTTMDKCGPMCRYVEDTVLVLNAIYGPDKFDPSVADAAFKWNPDAPLAGFKIAYVKASFDNAGGRGGGAGRGAAGAAGGRAGAAPTPEQVAAQTAAQTEMKKIYDDVLATYAKLGAKLEAVELPDLSLTNSLSFILDVEASASFDDDTRSGEINQLLAPRPGSASTWPNTFRQARFIPAVEYIRAMRGRTQLMHTFDGFMSQYDALLEAGTGGTLSTTNLTGHPAMAVKCGITGGNTPRMLMLTGKLYDEGTLARIAMAYEQATEWKDRHPTLT
jgi:Asp-tRNA(Asn)/Glu-tRNA(Gln) amidotransferase A subunit family amidase